MLTSSMLVGMKKMKIKHIPAIMTKVKICCISSLAEAQMAIDYGANILGLVGPMPSGPGIITDELIFEIAQSVPPSIETFLLTSETNAEKIIEHHQKVKTTAIQIVDSIPIESYAILRQALPGIKLVQVIHVIDDKSVEEAIKIAQFVNYILVDSGNPNLAVKELGGTGRTHNWMLSKQIRAAIKIPLFLAGGLKAENVQKAIDAVQPYGVDLCSGVRRDHQLDGEKLAPFFKAINKL